MVTLVLLVAQGLTRVKMMMRAKGRELRARSERARGREGEYTLPRSLPPFIALCSMLYALFIISAPLANADSYSCEFLSIGAGTRASGLGGAFVAVADDSTAAYWNPAGLYQLEGRELVLMHAAKFSRLATFDCISYAQVLPVGAVGISWLRFGVGDIPRFPEPKGTPGQRKNSPVFRPSPKPEGYFSDSENALFLSLGRKFAVNITPGLQLTKTWAMVGVGGSLKMISQTLDKNRSRGLGADVGLLFSMDAGSLVAHEGIGELTLGLNIQDIGTKIRWNTTSQHEDILPTNFKFGIAYSFLRRSHSFTAALDRDTVYDRTVRFGLEYWYRNAVALRIGVQTTALSAGFGVRREEFSVDYAYLKQEIAGSHQLGASIRF